jgi:hypothetical protein
MAFPQYLSSNTEVKVAIPEGRYIPKATPKPQKRNFRVKRSTAPKGKSKSTIPEKKAEKKTVFLWVNLEERKEEDISPTAYPKDKKRKIAPALP